METHDFTLAQINPVVGDIAGNCALIRGAHAHAFEQGASLVIFPELAIIGYPPEDLLYTPKLIRDAAHAINDLAQLTTQHAPAILVGSLHEQDGELYNAAFLLDNGTIHSITLKHHLPNFGVFDEQRYFAAGELPSVILWRDKKLGVMICEDMWHEDVPAHLASQGADCFITINASPFDHHKQAQRIAWASRHCTAHHMPLFYVNMHGGQDEVVFDGGSFIMNPQGGITSQFPYFEECIASQAHAAPHPYLPCDDDGPTRLCG
jgi:NAD+ synthase